MIDIEKTVYDMIVPLVDDKQALSVKRLESVNDNEIIVMIYAKNNDIGRLIGRKGTMANALRQVLQIASRQMDTRIQLKYEAIE